jgi:3-oxoacyl-[acyl-carrier protein] reductase
MSLFSNPYRRYSTILKNHEGSIVSVSIKLFYKNIMVLLIRLAVKFAAMLPLNLNNKNALIAGSTQGIGLASAQQLAQMGANCILIARNEERLKEAMTTLDISNGQQHQYIIADFSNPANVASVIQKLVESQTIHILVNNTGGPAGGPITTATSNDFLSAFNQHLICNHIISSLVIDGMKNAGFGRIINIISTSVKIPLKGLGVSNTIRGAVASWAKTMANELGAFGITVNNVLPGATSTARLSTIINNKSSKTNTTVDDVTQEMLHEIPAGRFALPSEIAYLVGFLSSDAAAYINGTSIPVDGGRTGSI